MSNLSAGTISIDLELNDSAFDRALTAAEGKAKAAGEAISSVDFSGIASGAAAVFDNIAASIGRVAWNGLQTGATLGGAAITALGIKGLLSANELQTLQISMDGLTHSTNLGAQAMAGALKYAQQSPFQLPDVAATTKMLIAFGQSANDAVSNLGLLGNISITTGVPLQAIGNIFGQVSAQGILMDRDIQQLTENGVAILPALEKEFGKTGQQILDMATKGQIGFDQFKTALASLVDPTILDQLTNTLPRQLDRLGGSLRILSNSFVGVGVDAVNGFTMASNGIDQAATTLTKKVADSLRSPELVSAAAAIGTQIAAIINAITPLVGPIVAGISKITEAISGMGTTALPLLGLEAAGFSGLAANIPILGNVLGGLSGPMGLIIGLIAAMVASSPQLRTGIVEAFAILQQTLTSLQPVFAVVTTSLVQIATVLGNALAPLLPAIANAFGQVLTALAPLIPLLLQFAVQIIQQILIPILPIVVQAIGLLAQFLVALIHAVTPLLPPLMTLAITILREALLPVLNAIAPLLPALANAFGQLLAAIMPLLPPLVGIASILLTALAPILPQLISAFVQLVIALLPLLPPLVDLITVLLPPLTGLLTLTAQVVGALAGVIASVLVVAINILTAAVQAAVGFIVFFGNVLNGIGGFIQSAANQLGNLAGQFISTGANIVSGIVQGLSNAAGAVINKIKEICSSALDAVKNFFGIHSPSSVMADIGENLMKGLADGISKAGSLATGAMTGVSKDLQNALTVPTGNFSLTADGSAIGAGTGGKTLNQSNVYNVYTQVDPALIANDVAWRAQHA